MKDCFVVTFVIKMVQNLSLSKIYPADRTEPVTSTPTDSTPTDAFTPTDTINPEPEVVEVQPPVLNRPPSKAKSLQIEAKRKLILLIKKYSIAPVASGDSSLNHQKISREIANYTNSVHDLGLELQDFWRRNKALYPGLYQLARVVHALPATSAENERVWSTYGLILSSRRSALNHRTINIGYLLDTIGT